MYACLYFFSFFCYHKLVNKDLYNDPTGRTSKQGGRGRAD